MAKPIKQSGASAFEIITQALSGVRGEHRGDSYWICCPFHDEKTPSCSVNLDDTKPVPIGHFYCFSKETKVLTSLGTKKIGKMAGGTYKVLTDNGVWVDAKFDSYGIQRLYKLTLSRNGVTKKIYTTKEHDWYTRDRKTPVKTIELKPGNMLKTNVPVRVQGLQMDISGIRHGFVLGDGTLESQMVGGQQYSVAYLYAHKIDFMEAYFSDYPQKYVYDYSEYGHDYKGKQVIIRGLPSHWKELPKVAAVSNDYAYGFLAGLLAADGCVDKDGTVSLHSSNKKVLQRVRDIATSIGINTLSITCQSRKGYGEEESDIYRIHFCRGSFPSELLLNPEHRERFEAKPPKFDYLRWRVVSVKKTKRVEEVFCCVVPETHRFTLEDNILTGNCFGCSEGRGPWNKLANKLGLPEIKEWQNFKENAGQQLKVKLKSASLTEVDKLMSEIKSNVAIPWPEDKEWRGYKGKLINKLGGQMYNDPRKDELMLVFPIYINGKLRGGVRAFLKKVEKRASYLTTEGSWVKSHGLFGYDLAKKLIRKRGLKKIVLVEGPRDALRLLSRGIPACAVLGTKNFNDKKALYLTALGVDEILVMPDNDRAGKEMWELVKAQVGHLCKTTYLRLPKEKDKAGKLIKLDPDSAPKEIIREVKKLVYKNAKKAA